MLKRQDRMKHNGQAKGHAENIACPFEIVIYCS